MYNTSRKLALRFRLAYHSFMIECIGLHRSPLPTCQCMEYANYNRPDSQYLRVIITVVQFCDINREQNGAGNLVTDEWHLRFNTYMRIDIHCYLYLWTHLDMYVFDMYPRDSVNIFEVALVNNGGNDDKGYDGSLEASCRNRKSEK